MDFIGRLQEKLDVDALCTRVKRTLGPPGSASKVDREAVRELLSHTRMVEKKERDLTLFVGMPEKGKSYILVLDNELALYHTDVEDVALRKSPTVKEIISIRNIRRIMNDADVVKARRHDTVKLLRRRILETLDLAFGPEDTQTIETMLMEGLNAKDAGKTQKALALFSELLGLTTPKKNLGDPKIALMGLRDEKSPLGEVYNPVLAHDQRTHRLMVFEGPLDLGKGPVLKDLLNAIAKPDRSKFLAEDKSAATFLTQSVNKKYGLSQGKRVTLPVDYENF